MPFLGGFVGMYDVLFLRYYYYFVSGSWGLGCAYDKGCSIFGSSCWATRRWNSPSMYVSTHV